MNINNVVDYTNLVPGKRYRLHLSDCCVGGEIDGVFEEHINPDEDEWYGGDLKFDIGQFHTYNRITFEMLND